MISFKVHLFPLKVGPNITGAATVCLQDRVHLKAQMKSHWRARINIEIIFYFSDTITKIPPPPPFQNPGSALDWLAMANICKKSIKGKT